MIRIFSSDTLQEWMLVCNTISELRFYGCCFPCFFYKIYYLCIWPVNLIILNTQKDSTILSNIISLYRIKWFYFISVFPFLSFSFLSFLGCLVDYILVGYRYRLRMDKKRLLVVSASKDITYIRVGRFGLFIWDHTGNVHMILRSIIHLWSIFIL